MNTSKQKRNRRKERKKNKVIQHSLKVIGVNAAGLLSEMHSFEQLLKEENPSVFCLQEMKLKKVHQIKTDSSKIILFIYELLRKKSNGGGLCIGVQNNFKPVWVGQGDDEVEALAVELWVDDFPIRIVTAYGPQVSDAVERKLNFLDFIEQQATNAHKSGCVLFCKWIAMLT